MEMTPKFRLLVCGGRDYYQPNMVAVPLDILRGRALEKGAILVIVQGGAKGADQCAREWALGRGVECETFHADWAKHGRAAGPIRNQQMLDSRPDMVCAFPGGAGTADMVRRARAAGVEVFDVAAELAKHGDDGR
jgi:1-aminocyclopropane-1-carboxylate deaminase/D-cysteine desulfhydrase-like pyridoxal-dependent ACC family enzyme